nr:Lipopolysaccharide kinase (Kdo/WaaP) family [Streptococcus thermophilus]
MSEKMSIQSPAYAKVLLRLPWSTPLENWPAELLAAHPRGISRHTVRLISAGGAALAIKEIGESVAYHEYRTLKKLRTLDIPCVTPVAVVANRTSASGEEQLTPCLVTEHLEFSLPYRDVFSRALGPETVSKLIRALAVLLVRLHLLNFYWGDVSLSNTLFRRDADEFSAYLVDAETGEFHEPLSRGRRLYDVELARVNIIGELMDLQAGGYIDAAVDVIALGNAVDAIYHELWGLMTEELVVEGDAFAQIAEHVEKIHALGFDIGETEISHESRTGAGNETVDVYRVSIEPAVFSTGFHRRKLKQLTGLDVQDRQAQRLLGEMEVYRALHHDGALSQEEVALDWLVNRYDPIVALTPPALRAKLEPVQVFHEILDHRWFVSENESRYVPLDEAAQSYFRTILPARPDEARIYTAETHNLETMIDDE